MATAAINPAFLEFLGKTPEFLAQFARIIDEFYKIQNTAPAPVKTADGPKTFHAGETHALTTVGVSNEDLDALAKGYGEAIVKEKAIQFVKGFVSGVMLAAH